MFTFYSPIFAREQQTSVYITPEGILKMRHNKPRDGGMNIYIFSVFISLEQFLCNL